MASSIRDPEMQSDDCLANGNLGGASCEQATVLWSD